MISLINWLQGRRKVKDSPIVSQSDALNIFESLPEDTKVNFNLIHGDGVAWPNVHACGARPLEVYNRINRHFHTWMAPRPAAYHGYDVGDRLGSQISGRHIIYAGNGVRKEYVSLKHYELIKDNSEDMMGRGRLRHSLKAKFTRRTI